MSWDHEADNGVEDALNELSTHCSVVQILGSYPRAIAPLNT